MKINLQQYKKEATQELHDILAYWMRYTKDEINGGFFGKVNEENVPDFKAEKGIVLNSRLLWAFSAAFNQTKNKEYLFFAQRACQYITDYFFDKEYAGVYWSVDYKGEMMNDRKQIYGLAFCIYSFSEYYKTVNKPEILQQAINLFQLIEQYAFDNKRKGYYEAFARNWLPAQDLRLSEKDANEKKTMNTHIHIIEAYANLYEVWPDGFLKIQIENLLEVFSNHIINKETNQCILFFDEAWNAKSQIISYGHDIEAAWLLKDCAEKINSNIWIDKMKTFAVEISIATQHGLDNDGGLFYEYDKTSNHLIKEKHWWPQAEAMVGFLNAYQISNDEIFLERSLQSWEFIKKYIKDYKNGEWFWGINEDYSLMKNQDKAGFWKCPYHNTRACLEVMKRIK